jgi:two-component system, NtrC family, sensor histidine kinase HydH
VVDRTDDLSREELLRLLDATRAMARATVEPRFDDMMAMVLKIALSATKSDRAGLYMLEPGSTGDLVLVGRHPPPEADTVRRVELVGSPMEEPLTTGVPRAYVASALGAQAEPHRSEGIHHIAIVPVDVRGKPGASFNIARMLDSPYDPRELRFAQVLGELLVVYADNARLYAEAQERLDETRILVEVARAVSASPELDARLDASATILAHMLDASNAFILLLEEEGTVLHGVTASNPADREEFRAVRIHCSEPSIAARAVATKQPIVVEDATSSSEVQRSLVSRYGEKSLVALPLMLRDEAIGVVVFDDTRRVRTWAASEIQRAELIVQTVAVGVANARLYDEVRRRSRELERAQAELVKRERLAALGQLAAVMAHEVRNPLGVLFNSIGTLAKLPSEGDSAQLLGIMREEATRLERLVRELLDFAKPLAPSLESEALHPLLLGAVDAATRELGPTTVPPIDVVVTADLPNAWLDASMMRRAVVNLVVNAVHAAGRAGRVEVRAAPVVRGQRRLVHLTVTDSGPGIPPGVVPRVFEPFFTTKATGTGLGLAVVKSIVESHGGDITLESTTGRGTVVSVFLPVAPESAEGEGPKRRRSAW